MTKTDIETLKKIEIAPEDLRRLCWKYRKENDKDKWFFLTSCGVQDIQLKRFLDDEKGISTTTMSRIAKWLINNS